LANLIPRHPKYVLGCHSVLGNEVLKANKIKNDDRYYNNEDNKINRVTLLDNNYFLWFPKDLVKQLKQYALDNDATVTYIIIEACTEFLARKRK
jgi:hypothetical protein